MTSRSSPGGIPSQKGFNKLIRANQTVRLQSRHDAMAKLHIRNTSELWDYFRRTRKTRTSGEPYYMSEWVYYLRYHYNTTMPFYAIPDVDDPYYETYCIYKEISKSSKEAWGLYMESRLSDITACGHLADTLTWRLFFEDKDHAEMNVVVRETEHAMDIIEDLKAMILENKRVNYLIRCEINDNHVFVYDLPAIKGKERYAYHVESCVYHYDSYVGKLNWLSFVKALKFEKNYLDYISVYTYDAEGVTQRIHETIENTWDIEYLNREEPYYTKSKNWNEILEMIYRLNMANETKGRGIWKTISQYLF